jgi:aryl-alcohol dehydrogenase-like predicted oxidoreductase
VTFIDTADVYGPHSNEELIREALHPYPDDLVVAAQRAGTARDDVSIDDVMRFVIGVTSSPFGSDDQRDRILRLAVDAVQRR